VAFDSHHIDNHEIVVQFSAKIREELRVDSLLRKQGSWPSKGTVTSPACPMRRCARPSRW
jgi:hypothetical protein